MKSTRLWGALASAAHKQAVDRVTRATDKEISAATGAGDGPSELAMKIAVAMEVHAACGTTTRAKGVEIDKHLADSRDALRAKDAEIAELRRQRSQLAVDLFHMARVVSNAELKLAEKHCEWPAFKNAFDAVMKSRRAALKEQDQ